MTFVKVEPHIRSDQPGITVAANRRSLYVNAAAIRCLGLGMSSRYTKVPVDLLYDEATQRASLTLNVGGELQTHYLTKMDSGGRIECAGFVRWAFGALTPGPPIRLQSSWEPRRKMLVFSTATIATTPTDVLERAS